MLEKDLCRLDIRRYSFSQKAMNEWNKLFTDCVNSSTMNILKSKINKYLGRAGLYTDDKLFYGKPIASLSTCHVGVLPWMAILLNLFL